MKNRNRYLTAGMLCGMMLLVNSCQKDVMDAGDALNTREAVDLNTVFSSYEIVEVDFESVYRELDATKGAATKVNLNMKGPAQWRDFSLFLNPGNPNINILEHRIEFINVITVYSNRVVALKPSK